jgi:hypothetical protein
VRRLIWCVIASAIFASLAPGAADGGIEFRAVDLFLDPSGQSLAAYQLDWTISSQNGVIVGVEGGEGSSFNEPPYYDPKAIQHEHVIVAAFKVTDARNLPKQKTRVATIHLQTSAGAACSYKFHKAEAATSNGRRITIEASSRERIAP